MREWMGRGGGGAEKRHASFRFPHIGYCRMRLSCGSNFWSEKRIVFRPQVDETKQQPGLTTLTSSQKKAEVVLLSFFLSPFSISFFICYVV